ncbi:uncharacterized protein LOC128884359 isoform X3 [Hylaeus volcanicus]|uniref:uncharacterized protein LOC128884359 isoform X3 n=1 Tax=Hylaeus volcanicus TaxID=313075 RepID=UPI0023B84EA0|nr:uncharacterized protein LOC128884359 isoform X3 [Hylaeus volcanicus]XP_053993680.1 uncharacterized protein LOC128884359 isoform X3 [Hylaeus volcanicus]
MTCEETPFLLKLLILGDSGVGKTSLMNRWVQNKFSNQYRATIGADFSFRTIRVDNQKVTVQIWDTAGQERFKSLGVTFYRGADCCIFVYDVSSQESFENITFWRNEFFLQCVCHDAKSFPCMIIGNKDDLPSTLIKVNVKKAEKWSTSIGALHATTSAYAGENVETIFLVSFDSRSELIKLALFYRKKQSNNLYQPRSITVLENIKGDLRNKECREKTFQLCDC